jgi:hypothetical protein
METIFSAVTLVLLNAMVLALAFDPITSDASATQLAAVQAQSPVAGA